MEEPLESARLTSPDSFFYYGESDLRFECVADLIRILLQPKKKMYYNRQEGVGVPDYENYPNALTLQVGLRYAIANGIAYRNQVVTVGTPSSGKERRIAVSQTGVSFEQSGGEMNVSVLMYLYADYKTPVAVKLPIGIKT